MLWRQWSKFKRSRALAPVLVVFCRSLVRVTMGCVADGFGEGMHIDNVASGRVGSGGAAGVDMVAAATQALSAIATTCGESGEAEARGFSRPAPCGVSASASGRRTAGHQGGGGEAEAASTAAAAAAAGLAGVK